MSTLEPLMEKNFLEYASYVIVDRAIPELRDGCKPVQRRILYTLHKMDDGKFHKVANVIGETMKLHPHGDASIGDALVVLANKDYFIEKQGNFGNIVTGHRAAAPRYTECRLTPLARDTLFNDELTRFRDSYDGRNREPIALPVKLPVLLMLGIEGIAVGMSTRVLPHNLIELLQAQVNILNYEPVTLYPDFPNGGIMDISEYDEGRGKVRIRAKIETDGDKRIVIREIPWSTTTEALIASIEIASQKKKIKIASINDFTSENVEIEILLPRGVTTNEVVPQLYAYTSCEVSLTSNITVIRNGHPVNMSVNEVLRELTAQLRDQICAELQLQLQKQKDRQHWLTLEQIFIENRVYKKIEEAATASDVTNAVYDGMKPFETNFIRTMTDEDVERLLEIRIRRISLYDQKRNRKQLREVASEIDKTQDRLNALTQTTIGFLKDLIQKYKDTYPRRTSIDLFSSVDKKDVARQNIKVGYDPNTGFFGSEVKESDYVIAMSEYDRVLFVSRDGSYRIVAPEEKILIPGKVIYWEPFDQENGIRFSIVYRDENRIAFAKKVHIHKFIKDREYELIKDKKGRIDLLVQEDLKTPVRVHFSPAKRQRVTEQDFDMSEVEFSGITARGRRISPKSISRVQRLRADSSVDTAAPVTESLPPAPVKPRTDPSDSGGQTSLF